jgi:hypothetical protein
MFCPSLVWISDELNWKLHPASTRSADSCAPDQWLWLDCQSRAKICGWLATPWTDFIPSWDRRWWNPFTAISLNQLTMRVNVSNFHELLSSNYLIFNSIIDEKVSRNLSDTPTSNRRPSISTSREIRHFTPKTLRFRSTWRWWTREMPWIWHRGNSRHHDREFISSHSRDWRVF